MSHIYFNELTLEDKNKFYLDFSENNLMTNSILFLPKKDYFITSMFCPLDISPDVTQSRKYKQIKKLSDFDVNEKVIKKARSTLPTTIFRQVVLHLKIQATKKFTMKN